MANKENSEAVLKAEKIVSTKALSETCLVYSSSTEVGNVTKIDG